MGLMSTLAAAATLDLGLDLIALSELSEAAVSLRSSSDSATNWSTWAVNARPFQLKRIALVGGNRRAWCA
jgi:hypothetical protein